LNYPDTEWMRKPTLSMELRIEVGQRGENMLLSNSTRKVFGLRDQAVGEALEVGAVEVEVPSVVERAKLPMEPMEAHGLIYSAHTNTLIIQHRRKSWGSFGLREKRGAVCFWLEWGTDAEHEVPGLASEHVDLNDPHVIWNRQCLTGLFDQMLLFDGGMLKFLDLLEVIVEDKN